MRIDIVLQAVFVLFFVSNSLIVIVSHSNYNTVIVTIIQSLF